MAAMSWEDAGRLAFQNLLLLGLDTDEVEKKHSVELSEQTFLQQHMAGSGLGPHKAMEVVMHFLMLKVLAPELQAPLKQLFPVTDKQQARDFRKFVTDHLSALQKARELPPGPLIRSTIFDSPSGPKFCQMLFHVSQYTMKRQMIAMKKSSGIALPAFQRQNARSLVRVARHRVAHERRLFMDHIRRAGAAQECWAQFAHECVEAYQSATSSRAQVAAAQQALLSRYGADADVCLDHEAAEAKAEAADRHVHSMWAAVEQSSVASKSQRDEVESLLVRVEDEKSINITELMRQSLHDVDPSAPLPCEGLDIEALLQRWAANIGQVHRQLLVNTAGRDGLQQLAASAPAVHALAEEAEARVMSAQDLRRQLATDLDAVRRSIASLRKGVAERYEAVGADLDESLNAEEAEHSWVHTSDSASPGHVWQAAAAARASPGQDEHRKHDFVGFRLVSPPWKEREMEREKERTAVAPVLLEAAASARASTSAAKVKELDLRMQHLRNQLANPNPNPNAPHASDSPPAPAAAIDKGSPSKAQAQDADTSLNRANRPNRTANRRPAPAAMQLSDGIRGDKTGQDKDKTRPTPPPTPPPLYAALRGKRSSANGHATLSPPGAAASAASAASKTVLGEREVLVEREAVCDPAQKEIERRRASLRSKMTAALDDDLLASPAQLSVDTRGGGLGLVNALTHGALAHGDAIAKELSQMVSPPKHAGKGSVVGDDLGPEEGQNRIGRFFDDA
jgi:hypothetical protein